MKAAGQIESEEHEECGGRLRCPLPPTSLALKRRGGRSRAADGCGRVLRSGLQREGGAGRIRFWLRTGLRTGLRIARPHQLGFALRLEVSPGS